MSDEDDGAFSLGHALAVAEMELEASAMFWTSNLLSREAFIAFWWPHRHKPAIRAVLRDEIKFMREESDDE